MTLEDFYAEVLQKLGALAAEEAPSASDRDAAKDKYEQLHAEYSRRDLLPWFDDEDVPEWAADAFATIVANRLTNKFSVSQDTFVKLATELPGAITVIVGDGQYRQVPNVKATFY